MTNSTPPLGGISSEHSFQLLVEGVTDYAILMLDPAGFIRTWNAGAQRFKGYAAREIIGQHFSIFYPESDRIAGRPALALQTALDEGKSEDEGWRVRKDGSQFWASVVIDPLHDDSGRFIGFAKITRDITERKRAQEALRESEQRFSLLVEGVTDYAIFMLSPTGEVTNWNTGAERIKGYSRDEILGKHFSCFYTEKDRAAGLPAQTLAIAGSEGRFEREGWRVRKDGTRFWAHVVVDAIRDEAGRLVGFAKVIRDVTERKQAADALARANTALFQSQKMESLGQLTGGVAHDFNNLLAVMSNGLDVLSLRLHEHADIRMLEMMQRAVTRGATLTQQLLSFARQQPLKVEKCNLNAVLRGFEAVLRRAADGAIELEVRQEPRPRPVLLDAARFEAALLNLVVNARDAMPDGGKIVIAVENVELGEGTVGALAPGPYVTVSVTDTGSGMPPEVAARAFEPFFTTKEVGKGTGLGLSQAYGFIAQSGGDVLIHSEPGKGTTVSMYLPVATGTSGDADTITGPALDTVLVVEDEPDLLEATAELLRSLGYEVLTASNGAEAMDVLSRRDDIGVLFTDVVMPNGINGVQLARSTRELHPEIRIVLASGYALPALKAQHGNLSDFAFINKPYRLADIVRTLGLGT
ncbi:PAS domain-containing sensor histidine kinase [Paraburkholderia sp. UYCP14C]|uniref:hybrid sensor histidine kinase/response regulator n=1 Tax=Paraburkholderia sp. UYCP14C TaxID=2511130 RepID=UPI0010222CB0|nr:PAS domain-containing sensor histidine kinase [Paraburkholderia sp. UYCP14C]RZF26625.1 PAS domain-containing sensor histidine kinase [Paraburkholderia sp. UYCP14C]